MTIEYDENGKQWHRTRLPDQAAWDTVKPVGPKRKGYPFDPMLSKEKRKRQVAR